MKKIAFILSMLFVLSIASGPVFGGTDAAYENALKYYNSGNYKEAARLFREYVEKRPDPDAYYRLGYSLYELGRYDEANIYFKEAYLIDPSISIEYSGSMQKQPTRAAEEPALPPAEKAPAAELKTPEKKEEPAKQEAEPKKTPKPETAEQKAEHPSEAQMAETFEKMLPPSGMPSLPEPPQSMPLALPAGLAAVIAGFAMVFLVAGIAMLIYYCLCLFLIGKKLNVPSPWVAWIPLLNYFWPLIGAAGKSLKWGLLYLLFIPLLGGGLGAALALVNPLFAMIIMLITFAVSFVAYIYLWMCISENLGKNRWLGLLMLVPIVQLVWIGILAFSKPKSTGSSFGEIGL